MSRLIPNQNHLSEEELAQRKAIQGRLLFTLFQGRECAFLLREDQLLAAEVLPASNGKIGSIHIGRVKNVVKNIDACFVEITEKELCFLPMKEARFPYLLNRAYDGRLLEGDELLVQVTRDAQKTKQASVSAHISLANEAFAISIGSDHVGFSGKLTPEQKTEVRTFLEQHQLMYKGHFTWNKYDAAPTQLEHLVTDKVKSVGLIARTQAGSISDAERAEALHSLLTAFYTLLRNSLHRTCFTCLQEAPGACEAVLQSIAYPREYQEIVTDQEELFRQLNQMREHNVVQQPVRLYQDEQWSLSKLYSLERRMEEALSARVWLKSGGYLVIEPTEALTVIDVNSGKYSARKTSAEMAILINQEAALEVARQLRLRNLSGMILVDFINMASSEQEEALLEQLREAVKWDKQKVNIVDITPLGLVEITRKKELPTLREQLQNTI